MSKLKLDITLIAVTGIKHGETVAAMRKSMDKADFADAVLLTNIDLDYPDIRCINVGGLESIQQYSKFIIRELHKYFKTSHCLIVQYDSWVIHPECWEDEFLDYDIIGAPGMYVDDRQNLNGGFSIRSHRFQEAIALDESIDIFHPCDEVLCRLYRLYLIKKYGFKYAPDDIGERFSYELRTQYCKSFGFHNFHLPDFKEHVLIRREAAMGDIIMATPIMDYYADKGYQVVLDTLPEMMAIFFNHRYRVKHISEVDSRIKYAKIVDLNMAYESKPKQNVLKTYYEFAGIEDGVLRNSRLYVNQGPGQELFKKFIVFHIDRTGMKHRDTYGVNWEFVNNYYQRLGYTCIQVGRGSGDSVGTFFNAETKQMLMYLLKGASAVCAIDSGVAQLSVALDIPTAIFFGSVNPVLRYNNFDKIEVIKTPCPVKIHEYCYHESEGSVTGTKCRIDEEKVPCSFHDEWSVIKALNKLLKLN